MKAVTSGIRGILGESKQMDIDNKKANIVSQIKNLTDQKRKIQGEMSVLVSIESVAKRMANVMGRTKTDLDNAGNLKVNRKDIGVTANARIDTIMGLVKECANTTSNNELLFRKQVGMCEADIVAMSKQVNAIDAQIKRYKDENAQLDRDASQLKRNGVNVIREQSVQDGVNALKNSQ